MAYNDGSMGSDDDGDDSHKVDMGTVDNMASFPYLQLFLDYKGNSRKVM